MALKSRVNLTTRQALTLSGQMRESLAILRLPTAALLDDIAREAADNPFLVERASDHDGFVLFLEAENMTPVVSPPPEEGLIVQFSQPIRAGGGIYLNSRRNGALKSIELYTLQGQLAWRRPLSGQEATLRLPEMAPGRQMYILRVAGEKEVRVEKLMVE